MKARSLTFDRTHDTKKETVGEGLTYTPKSGQVEANRSGNVDNWLEGLWLELHSLAIAGCTPVAPAPTDPERRSSDPTKYVVVPLCTVQRYLWRA